MICRTSSPADVPRLKELWKTCFGDSDGYIDHFFQTAYVPQRALVLEAEGVVASMLLTFPETIVTAQGQTAPAWYVYAFCTAPDCQGKGYGRALLAWTEEQARAAGCAAVLMVPGEDSLFQFYHTLGYTLTLNHREVTLPQNQLPITQPHLSPISPEEYAQERCLWLAGLDCINPTPQALIHQKNLCRCTGGDLFRLADGIAAVEVWEGTAEVKELLCADLTAGAAAIAAALGTSQVHIYLPAPLDTGTEVPFAVVKWLKSGFTLGDTTYFAFAFD